MEMISYFWNKIFLGWFLLSCCMQIKKEKCLKGAHKSVYMIAVFDLYMAAILLSCILKRLAAREEYTSSWIN